MVRLVNLLHLSTWVAASNALFIWEACRVDGSCPSAEGKTVDPRADGEGAQPLTLGIHHRTHPAGYSPEDQALRHARRLSNKYGNRRGYRPSVRETEGPSKSSNQYRVMAPVEPELSNAIGIYQDGNDFAYFVRAEIGSAKQPVYMLFDTGAGSSWVMGSDCTTEPCAMHDTWDPLTSKTYEDPAGNFSVNYGTGSVEGITAMDSISLGGVDITMKFGVADKASDDFKHFPFDGILGMSMTKTEMDNFALGLKNLNELKSNIFSVYLDRGSSEQNHGELTLGGINDDKYTGDIGYTSIGDGLTDWAIPLDDIGADEKTLGIDSRLAYVDTGTSFIFGPPEDVKALHKLIPGATSEEGINWRVPCDTKKKVTFTFSGKRYTVGPVDYISASPGGGLCKSNIYGHEVVRNGWLLGDVFLKNVYAVFDMDKRRIGFASMKDSTSGGDDEPTAPAGDAPEGSLPFGVGGPESSRAGGASDDGDAESTAEPPDDEGQKPSGQSGFAGERIPCRTLLGLAMGVAAAGYFL